jgi:hypothetical protein
VGQDRAGHFGLLSGNSELTISGEY